MFTIVYTKIINCVILITQTKAVKMLGEMTIEEINLVLALKFGLITFPEYLALYRTLEDIV